MYNILLASQQRGDGVPLHAVEAIDPPRRVGAPRRREPYADTAPPVARLRRAERPENKERACPRDASPPSRGAASRPCGPCRCHRMNRLHPNPNREQRDTILIAKSHIAGCYEQLGREDDLLNTRREVYLGMVELRGTSDYTTILAANQLMGALF